VGGAGSAQIVPTTPRPFALLRVTVEKLRVTVERLRVTVERLRVTWMQSFWGKADIRGKEDF